jgi:O-antigen ligase
MIEIGIENWQKHPMLGLGLANFPLSLKSERMEFGDSLDDAFAGVYKRAGAEGQEIKGFHWVWVTHNIYILLLAEIGTLGLLAFLLFVWWALRAGLHARRLQDPVYRGASIGLLVGICGVLLQMMSDWAIWLDPILYTFAIVASLLNNLPLTANEIPLPFDSNGDQLQK